MRKTIFSIGMLAILLISIMPVLSYPGEFPYPVFGTLTEKDSGKPVAYVTIIATTSDGKEFTATTDKAGNYQIELSTAYLNENVKIGIKGNQQDVYITGSNLRYDIVETTSNLTTAAIAGGAALLIAGAYLYFRRTNRGKKLRKCPYCTDQHYCPK